MIMMKLVLLFTEI